jgi:hypothetical protein
MTRVLIESAPACNDDFVVDMGVDAKPLVDVQTLEGDAGCYRK